MILSHLILQRRLLHFNVSCMSVNNRFQAFDPNRPGVKPDLQKWTNEYSDCKDAKTTSAWTSINVTCQWNSPDIFNAHNPWPGHFLAETHGFPSHHILTWPIGPIGHASFVSGWRCLATWYSSSQTIHSWGLEREILLEGAEANFCAPLPGGGHHPEIMGWSFHHVLPNIWRSVRWISVLYSLVN